MRVLVTGGTGFLGRAFIKRALTEDIEITAPTSKDLDLTTTIDPSIFSVQFDVILHFATWTRAGDFCRKYKLDQWIINEKINLNIIEYWTKHQRNAHLISFGTSVCYNDENTLKVEENYLHNDPISDYYGYSTSKRSLLYGLQCAAQQNTVKYSHFIPSTIYGPEYHSDGRQLHFVYDIIKKLIIAKNANAKVSLWGDGYQKRELIYVDDVVDVLIHCLQNPINGLCNLSAGSGFTIRELANEICSQISFDNTSIDYDSNAFTGFKSKILCNQKLNDLFPFRKQTNLALGLQSTIGWVSETLL